MLAKAREPAVGSDAGLCGLPDQHPGRADTGGKCREEQPEAVGSGLQAQAGARQGFGASPTTLGC